MAKTSKTSTSSQVDFPARTSQSQEKGQESKRELGRVFGLNCGVLLAKYDPDLHSLRMSQCSLFGEEQELLQILPKSGMIVNGKLYQQSKLDLGIKERECGLLPTPTKTNILSTERVDRGESHENCVEVIYETYGIKTFHPILYEYLMGYPLGWTDLKDSETQ